MLLFYICHIFNLYCATQSRIFGCKINISTQPAMKYLQGNVYYKKTTNRDRYKRTPEMQIAEFSCAICKQSCQVANLLHAQANSASYPQWDEK